MGRPDALLEARNVSKTFPGLLALDRVSLSVGAGEIVGLVGQNGSGKSTLVKILAGVHLPDPGSEIVLGASPDGQKTELHFIHQDLGLVAGLSTIENLELGQHFGVRAILPAPVRHEERRARELITSFGVDFDVRRPIADLSAAERTMVAIARALHGWSHPRNVLVLDEPTASLHGKEVQKLFGVVRQVVARGAGAIFISHRLDEVLTLADRVVVLRDGNLIADMRRGEFTHDELVRVITGSLTAGSTAHGGAAGSKPVLQARDIRGASVRSLDLDLHAGEVLGISGVLGSGREEVASVLFGAAPGSAAALTVDGRELSRPEPRSAIEAGVAYVPADRHRQGMVMSMTVRENLTLPRMAAVRRFLGHLDQRGERKEAADWIARVQLRPADPERELALLSGGNQQKVMLAKWLRNQPTVLLLDEPTQGVDVGARAEIFELIMTAARQGAGIMICSSDTKELALVCDRVIVMSDGRAVAELSGPALSEAALVKAGLEPAASSDSGHPAAELGGG